MTCYAEKIKEYIRLNKKNIISDLKELVKIPSVSKDTETCRDILLKTKELYEKNGFETELDPNNEYLLSYLGNNRHSIGLFSHIDVVDASDGWTLSPPFEPKEIEGCLVGRGTLDDKSGVIISLYCMKMIRELEIPFDSRLVAFAGANEEITMHDVKSYLKTHTPPDFSLVIDSAFPIYNGDKGILWIRLKCDKEFEAVTHFEGGQSVNITLGKADARVKYSPSLYDELKQNSSVSVDITDNEIQINALGVSRHGALPEGSVNAGLIIINALMDAPSFNENDKKRLSFLKELLSDYYGYALGIQSEDENFGRLTCTNGIINMSEKLLSLTCDIRYGISVDGDKMIDTIISRAKENGMSVEILKSGTPSFISADDPYIQRCLKAYRDFSGDRGARAIINAGGTYSKLLPKAAEIGTCYGKRDLLSLPDGHGSLHQPDEYISIDGLLKAIELTLYMLIECDGDNLYE